MHLHWTYPTATHMQPMKLMVLGNKFVPLHSVAKYTGANTMLRMGEILVKRDFSGIADAILQLRTDFRLSWFRYSGCSEVCDCARNVF